MGPADPVTDQWLWQQSSLRDIFWRAYPRKLSRKKSYHGWLWSSLWAVPHLPAAFGCPEKPKSDSHSFDMYHKVMAGLALSRIDWIEMKYQCCSILVTCKLHCCTTAKESPFFFLFCAWHKQSTFSQVVTDLQFIPLQNWMGAITKKKCKSFLQQNVQTLQPPPQQQHTKFYSSKYNMIYNTFTIKFQYGI